MTCQTCYDVGTILLDDDSPKGVVTVPCPRCACEECGATRPAQWAPCAYCDAPEMPDHLAVEPSAR